jgi:5-methylcytosine-specific restriction endonuclease McrA
MKTCTKCGEEKALDAFGKDRSKADQMRTVCKVCTNNAFRARRAADPKKYREISQRSSRKWANGNPEAAREMQRRGSAAYRTRHPGRAAEFTQTWRKAHPDMVSAQWARKRARRRGASHEPYSRADIFAAYGGSCAYCGDPAEHLDHVKAISRGGADAAHNLLPACAPCNLSKGAKSLAEWAATF